MSIDYTNLQVAPEVVFGLILAQRLLMKIWIGIGISFLALIALAKYSHLNPLLGGILIGVILSQLALNFYTPYLIRKWEKGSGQ